MSARIDASPYLEAVHWIERNPGTGSATRLAKLVLSLWNSEAAFSFRECIESLDDTRLSIALRMVQTFAAKGETEDLVAAGYRVYELCPRIWELGVTGNLAKQELRDKWDRDRDAREQDE